MTVSDAIKILNEKANIFEKGEYDVDYKDQLIEDIKKVEDIIVEATTDLNTEQHKKYPKMDFSVIWERKYEHIYKHLIS